MTNLEALVSVSQTILRHYGADEVAPSPGEIAHTVWDVVERFDRNDAFRSVVDGAIDELIRRYTPALPRPIGDVCPGCGRDDHAPSLDWKCIASADGEIPCIDSRGHSWVVSDENENICYCDKCGCMEY